MDYQSRNELEHRDGLSKPKGINRQVVGGTYEMGYSQDIGPPKQ